MIYLEQEVGDGRRGLTTGEWFDIVVPIKFIFYLC